MIEGKHIEAEEDVVRKLTPITRYNFESIKQNNDRQKIGLRATFQEHRPLKSISYSLSTNDLPNHVKKMNPFKCT